MIRTVSAAAVLAALAASSSGDVVFQNAHDNGYFTPFSSSTAAGVKFGDSGWLSDFQAQNYTLTGITLGLCTFGGTLPGSTDLVFTFNDGDPSGQVFGSGAALYTTTVRGVTLPAGDGIDLQFFDLTIPLPNVQTLGGYNNIGFSVGITNFAFDGQFGFQCSSAFGQQVGYYTNNASQYNGSNWSLFSFGSGAFGVANFVATVTATPSPASLPVLASLLLFRRRR